MVGTKQLARVLATAEKAHAKVVLVGDPEQLQAIEAGAPFRGITRHGVAELNRSAPAAKPWQREATAALATGKTANALELTTSRAALLQSKSARRRGVHY